MPATKSKRAASKPKAAQATSKTGKAEPVERATHGLMVTNSEDGIEREIHIHRSKGGRYALLIRTRWPNVTQPVETRVTLSAVGFGLLSSVVMEAALNMERWPIPVKSSQSI